MKSVYSRPNLQTRYVYPRSFKSQVKLDFKTVTANNKLFKIIAVGIPDGISYITNQAVVDSHEPNRLFILSNDPLSEQTLDLLDKHYHDKTGYYPILEMTLPVGILSEYLPQCNFYMPIDGSSPVKTSSINILSLFVEYRYLQKQHQPANIMYDVASGNIFRFVPPDGDYMMALIMPENFIRTGAKQGYFNFNNIIIRIYSDIYLSASNFEEEVAPQKTDLSISNIPLYKTITGFFNRIGINYIYTPSDSQIVGVGRYFRAIVGNATNIVL